MSEPTETPIATPPVTEPTSSETEPTAAAEETATAPETTEPAATTAEPAAPAEEAAAPEAAEAAPEEAAPPEAAPQETAPQEAAAEETVQGGRTEMTAVGEKWGMVDAEGNVRLWAEDSSPGRIVGKVKGNPEAALGYFALKFQQIEAKVAQLETEVAASTDKPRLLGRVQRMLAWMPEANALGDVANLVARLRHLETECSGQLQENLEKKQALCERIQALAGSTDWKGTSETIRALQAEWKALGPAPKEHADAVWARFRGAADEFFERRKVHFETLDQERAANLAQKEELCARAEKLGDSTEWKAAAESLKALQARWKEIGPVPKEQAEPIWERFRRAADTFFDRRKAHFEELDRDRLGNLKLKEELTAQAEALAESTDWKAGTEGLKALQARWKEIGPVPKEQAEEIWARFRGACDRFFERRGSQHFEERGTGGGAPAGTTAGAPRSVSVGPRSGGEARIGDDVLVRKREQVSRLEESIAHDRGNVERWQSSMATLRPGGRAEEIRTSLETKIADVSAKMQAKTERLAELVASIRELEIGLARPEA